VTPSELGLDTFAHDLNPAIVGMIRSWQGDPELDAIYHRLQSRKMRRGFLDSFAEALVALHARRQGCTIQVEVPTPSGKKCDLLIERNGVKLYVHVKRLGGRPPRHRRLKISSRLRILERIQKPWVVKIRWHEWLDDIAMQAYVTAAASFIERARLGDEHVICDEEGMELGGVKIVAPNDEQQVSLVIGIPTGFVDDAPRVQRLLKRAHKQFMPKAANITLICTPHIEGIDEVESALLGAHVERWDQHPKKGKRVAHGRSDDGFWKHNQVKESQLAGWFWLAPMHDEYQGKLWVRDGIPHDSGVRDLAEDLFAT
jgi:hypothetical protein